ncbi:universal stress protein [Kitasatospora camelliae]|uniref:Universal stress protein n=1 Tax=Kitasatospora camelliae TaxID=3156397 RepID=A0AAU8JMZ1_9ACTN
MPSWRSRARSRTPAPPRRVARHRRVGGTARRPPRDGRPVRARSPTRGTSTWTRWRSAPTRLSWSSARKGSARSAATSSARSPCTPSPSPSGPWSWSARTSSRSERRPRPRSPARSPSVSAREGYDGALEFAFDAAGRRAAPLLAVHAASRRPSVITREHPPEEAAREADRRALAAALLPWRESYPDVHVVEHVSSESPARAVVGIAAGARLLVVGRGGYRTGLAPDRPRRPRCHPSHRLPRRRHPSRLARHQLRSATR